MLQRIAVYLVLIGYPAFVITPELQALPRPFGPGGGGRQTSTQTSTSEKATPEKASQSQPAQRQETTVPVVVPGGITTLPVASGDSAVRPSQTTPWSKTQQQTHLADPVSASGAEQVARGNYKAAADMYDAASKEAFIKGQNSEGADAAIRYGQVIESWSLTEPDQSWRLEAAKEAYGKAISTGTSQQQAIARNNLGVLLLRSGNTRDAVSAFKQINAASLQGPQQYLYHYNFARALEQDNDPVSSFTEYAVALKLRPDFESAAAGAFRVLSKLQSGIQLTDVTKVVNSMIASGQSSSAADRIYAVLDTGGVGTLRRELVGLLLRCIADATPDVTSFQKSERQRLSALRDRFPDLSDQLDDVRNAYEAELWSRINTTSINPFSRSWSDTATLKNAMSLCLKRVAQSYARNANPKEALARYYLSWDLDHEDFEAAVYAADASRADGIPVEVGHRLLDRLIPELDRYISKLFEGKSQAYQAIRGQEILRLHMVLAGILENEEKWGPSSNPHSVIFQLEHAAEAEKRLRAQNPKFPPTPGLHSRLAEAYKHVPGAAMQSWHQFVIAAEEYVDDGKAKEAGETLRRARELNVEETPEMRMQFSGVEGRVQSLLRVTEA